MDRTMDRPLPMSTLVDWVCSRNDTRTVDMSHQPAPAAFVARRLRINRGAYYDYLRDGLTLTLADKFATHLNLHPAQVWGEAWWAALDHQCVLDHLAHERRLYLNNIERQRAQQRRRRNLKENSDA